MTYSGSASDRLAAVQLAIGNCLAMQSSSSQAGSVNFAQLSELRKMEKELQIEVDIASSGSMSSLGFQTRPST
jgi:hypothetical protein